MAYATLDDLARVATGGWNDLAQRASRGAVAALVDGELLQATALGLDTSAWSVLAQEAAQQALVCLNDALTRASRHADTYLFPRYRTAMPLSPELLEGSDLPSVVAAIALKRLYGTHVPEDLRAGSKWADDYLLALAKGTVSLGGLDELVARPAGHTQVRSPVRIFGSNLRGY